MAAAGVPSWYVTAFMANLPSRDPPVSSSIAADHDHHNTQSQRQTPFDIAEYLLNIDDGQDDEHHHQTFLQENQPVLESLVSPAGVHSGSTSTNLNRSEARMEGGVRVAFRTKSEVEILDDGFKWRKYGKKSVKNNSYPRNYYRCSTEGCSVKKRVERDREDPSYVITTYDGVHNHTSPSVIYDTMRDDTSGQFLVSGCQMRQTP